MSEQGPFVKMLLCTYLFIRVVFKGPGDASVYENVQPSFIISGR